MPKIAIQDANILIDLVKTGLFDHCLALQYEFTTTEIILDELHEDQTEIIQPHINSGKFTVISISAVELIAIQTLSQEDNRLSEQDWSAVFYALQKEAILLSGDKSLRAIATAKQIIVHGIFWLMDQLIESKVLSNAEACTFLKKLISTNKRLPATEFEQRLKAWCK
jgi:hypothetical protein